MNTIYDGTYTIGQTSATNFVAGPGIKIDSPSAGTVRIGNDETVLWSGANMHWFNNTATVYSISGNPSDYETIKLITRDDWEIAYQEQEFPGTNTIWNVAVQGHEGDKYVIKAARLSANGNQISFLKANTVMISSAGAVTTNTSIPYIVVNKVIGINRKTNA